MPRHAGTWLSDDAVGPAYVEPVEFVPSTKEGFLIPQPAIHFLPWLDGVEKTGAILELAEQGRLIGHSPEILEDHLIGLIHEQQEILATNATSPSARTTLIALGERFIKAKINKNRYIYLNSRINSHLNLKIGDKETVFFIAVAGTFEIWTTQFYEYIRPALAKTIEYYCSGLQI
jgi:hypothetical protein